MFSNNYREPARDIPVLGHFDVIVCGGGAAGCAAAIAAARLGAETLLVEKDGYLGGATVSQLVGHVLSTNGVDFQGIWHEWMIAVRQRGGVSTDVLLGQPPHLRSGVDPEVVKHAWDDLLTSSGVTQLLHAYCAGAMVEDDVCQGVLVETRYGRQALYGKRIIDCTADGVVCAAAGVPWEQGNDTHPWGQSLTKVFRMGNVHWPEDGYSADDVQAAHDAVAQAVARGEYDSPVVTNGRAVRYSANNGVHRSVAPYRTEMNVFSSRVLQVDTLDPWDFTRAEREGRAQAWQCAQAIRQSVKGFEDAYLLDTNAHIGLRDSRRIHGRRTVTDEDAWNFHKYADGIARSSWQIDIWPADSYDAAAVDHASDAAQARMVKLIAGEYFDIRYGCLLAHGVRNLFVAGRCLSAERMAQGSLRIQQTCHATGQAAGAAAALSLQANVSPEALDIALLLAHLAKARDVEPAFAELSELPLAPRKLQE